jgi:hypothetical protein
MAENRFAVAVEAFRQEGRAATALEVAGPPPDPAELLTRSQEIEDAAATSLAAGDGDVREVGAIQLAAGAALDLAAAVDLLAREGLGAPATGALETARAPGREVDAVLAELQPVLAASGALGARAITPAPEEAALEAAMEPLPALGQAAAKAIDGIAGDAAKIAGHAVDGLVALPAQALLGAFSDAADKLLGPVYHQVSGAVLWAVRHIGKAISKLLRVLGRFEEPARNWLLDSIGDKTKDALTAWAIGRALGIDDIRADVRALIDGAARPGDRARLEAAGEEVASLPPRFGRHELVIRVLAKVLRKLQAVLLGLAGWVAAALAGVYVLMLAYGVWVAGDFLDWRRTNEQGRLDLVAGVRQAVRLAVTTA